MYAPAQLTLPFRIKADIARSEDHGRDSRGGRGGRREDDRMREREGNRERGMYEPEVMNLPYRSRPDTVRYEDHGRDARDKPRERSRGGHKDARSRSPRKERPREGKRDLDKEFDREGGRERREKSKSVKLEEEDTKSRTRTATPPVSFKVGASAAQDHDRTEMDLGKGKGKDNSADADLEEEEDVEIVIEDDGMAAMQAMMGFGGFSTTQNKKVPGNDISAVRKEKKTEYRQYMNRVGGFNRPLSPTREV